MFVFKEIYALELCSYDYLYSLFLICLLKVLRQALDSQEEKEWYWFLLKSCSCPWKSLSKLSNRNHLPRQRLQFPYHLAVVGQNALPHKRSVSLGKSGFPQDHLSNIIFHPSASRVSYPNLIVFFTLPRRIQAYSYSMIIVFLFPCLEHFFQVFTCLISLCNSGTEQMWPLWRGILWLSYAI